MATSTNIRPIRMRVYAPNSNINLAVRVELTGLYDVSTGPLGQRVHAVEARPEGDTLAPCVWVRLGDLEDDYGFPLCYADMRRALLWIWLENWGKPISNTERGLTPYERQCGGFDAY